MNEPVNQRLDGIRVAFVMTGSYCQLARALAAMSELVHQGASVLPVISYNVRDFDSRFGKAAEWRELIADITGVEEIIDTINGAEPIGPKSLADIMVIAPCTGNTIAKLALGVTDTPALMAAKSHLRRGAPLVVAISSNDALAANAKNIGLLLNTRNVYFVPFAQDDPHNKPTSIVAEMELIPETVAAALTGKQLQPVMR